MATIKIDVTQHHIDNFGDDVNFGRRCPLFQAALDAGLHVEFVEWESISLKETPESITWQHAWLPEIAINWQRKVNPNLLMRQWRPYVSRSKAELYPFSFLLVAPDWTLGKSEDS